MRIVVFRTAEEKAVGLQHRAPIEDQTLFVFPGIRAGEIFHSRNVREPFDIAFVKADGVVIFSTLMVPEEEMIQAPEETAIALESKGGNMARWGIVGGSVVSI